MTTPSGKGLLESLTTLTTTLVAVAHTRLDLLVTDLDEDRAHFLALLVLTQALLFCVGIGVVLTTITLVVAFWDSYRLQVLGGMAATFLGAGVILWAIARHKVRTRPRLFAGSLAELRKDHEQLEERR
jgi:uncharacterized membrane protein YqjE